MTRFVLSLATLSNFFTRELCCLHGFDYCMIELPAALLKRLDYVLAPDCFTALSACIEQRPT